MTYSLARAKYESELARAHRALWNAKEQAINLNDQGAVNECEALLLSVTQLAQDSLSGRKRAHRAQRPLPGVPR